mmetsp:Transcript_66648/g.192547  ORF Transcript_66648/g.192547 Transcript_66648/m.192547 type:complete len:214 (-) Transcript_66648:823-1464(-)
MLVLRRVEHQSGRAVLNLRDELVEALRLALAEAVDLHVVVQKLLPHRLLGHLAVHHVAGRHLLTLGGGSQHVGGATGRPPLERRAPLRDQVRACEGLVAIVANDRRSVVLAALVLRGLQSVDQLGTALLHASVGPGLLDVRSEVRVHPLDGHAGGRFLICEEFVLQRVGALLALRLVPLKQRVDEFVALWRAPLWDDQLLEFHILLALEGELA